MMSGRWVQVGTLIWVVLFASCLRRPPVTDDSAKVEATLRRFIENSAAVKTASDRELLMSLCIGVLRRALTQMSDEVFESVYVNAKLEIVELKFLRTKIRQDSAQVSYRVSVVDRGGSDTTEQTNEREATLRQFEDEWYVESIHLMGSDKIVFTRGMIF